MKTNIFWTIQQLDNSKFVTMALFNKNLYNLCFAITSEDGEYYKFFNTQTEAHQYITELNKPFYHRVFGNAYELKYLSPDSDEMMEQFDRFNETISLVNKYIVYKKLPWYKKIFAKHLPVFDKFNEVLG